MPRCSNNRVHLRRIDQFSVADHMDRRTVIAQRLDLIRLVQKPPGSPMRRRTSRTHRD
jgi:hypothetical protein